MLFFPPLINLVYKKKTRNFLLFTFLFHDDDGDDDTAHGSYGMRMEICEND